MTKKPAQSHTDKTAAERKARWRLKIQTWIRSMGYTSTEAYLTAQYNAAQAAPRKRKK
jgi:hypothetical protein